MQEYPPPTTSSCLRIALAAVATAAALAGGCRSGAQSDIVERELRRQEDQIYALQDDLSNYQQLVCQYRSENEALKQQLAESPTARSVPSTKPATSGDSSKSRLKQSPRTPAPPASKPSGPQLGEPETPGVPKLELGEPEVPPLKDSSAIRSPIIHVVAYEPAPEDVPDQVIVRGRIMPDDGATGPRIVAHVEPGLSSGQPVAFRGQMSLMVLDPNHEGHAASVARWDLGADDLDQAAVQTSRGPSLEFPLQLPPDAPTARPVDLWVRLLRPDGQKLLAHATIDLSRPGQFCSAAPAPLPTASQAVQVVDTSRAGAGPPGSAICKTDWQTARPDGPLSQASNQSEAKSEWRAATEPIPDVPHAVERIASPQPTISPPSPKHRTDQPESRSAQKSPDWSPERTERAASAAPVWSPLR